MAQLDLDDDELLSPVSLVLPSPDGHYLAMMPTPGGILWVYDRRRLEWANLGAATISPSADWGYMRSSWDPWFGDSSHLVYFSGSDLVVSSRDGLTRQMIWKTDGTGGLAAPSPDGQFIAFVSLRTARWSFGPI